MDLPHIIMELKNASKEMDQAAHRPEADPQLTVELASRMASWAHSLDLWLDEHNVYPDKVHEFAKQWC